MQPRLLCLLAWTLLGVSAFAQESPTIGLGAWGRAVWAPVVGTTDGWSEFLGTSWAGNPRIGFNVHGDSQTIGFHADVNVDGGTITAGDQQYVWARPLDQVTIYAGKYWYDGLRGNAPDFGSSQFLPAFDWAGNDLTFKRARTDGTNVVVTVQPFEGLQTFINVQGGARTQQNLLKSLQYGAGYTVPGWGQLKLQYIGDENLTREAHQVNGALRLIAVPGLTLDAGVYYPMDPKKSNLQYGANADYSLLSATLHGVLYYEQPQTTDAKWETATGLDYALGDGFLITSDYRYQNQARSGVKDGVHAAFVGITKDYSNGRIGIGVQYASTSFNNNGNAWATFQAPATDDPKKVHWALPILFQYWW